MPMGMKSNSGHFKGTNGAREPHFIKMNIQLFAEKHLPKKGKKLFDKATNIKLKNKLIVIGQRLIEIDVRCLSFIFESCS